MRQREIGLGGGGGKEKENKEMERVGKRQSDRERGACIERWRQRKGR